MNTAADLPVRGRIEFQAEDTAALRRALKAAHDAVSDDLEPNVLWAPGYRVGIIVEVRTEAQSTLEIA